MMPAPAAAIIADYRASLGEGPLWDHRRQRLIWCDILSDCLLIAEPDQTDASRIDFAGGITSIGLAEGDRFVATSLRRFMLLDSEFNVLATSAEIEPHLPDNRFNDGKVDPLGRFWAGTMEKECKGTLGAFYLLDGTGLKRLDEGYGCTNGPAFSPDGRWLCFTDSNEHAIYRAALSQNQSLERGGPFITFTQSEGAPDGMTFDNKGRLYVAHFGGGQVSRYDSEGQCDARFPLPASNITSVAFANGDLSQLVATSAHCTFTPEQLEDSPEQGATFAFDCGATGLPEPEFLIPEGFFDDVRV